MSIGQPVKVVSPRTGEILDLSRPDQDLAQFLVDAREAKSLIDEAMNLVQAEMVSRMDQDTEWTRHLKGMKATAPSPQPSWEYDAEALNLALEGLVGDGIISLAALERAIEPVTTLKVHASGIKALLKLGGVVAETIMQHAQEVHKRRYVKVSRVD